MKKHCKDCIHKRTVYDFVDYEISSLYACDLKYTQYKNPPEYNLENPDFVIPPKCPWILEYMMEGEEV